MHRAESRRQRASDLQLSSSGGVLQAALLLAMLRDNAVVLQPQKLTQCLVSRDFTREWLHKHAWSPKWLPQSPAPPQAATCPSIPTINHSVSLDCLGWPKTHKVNKVSLIRQAISRAWRLYPRARAKPFVGMCKVWIIQPCRVVLSKGKY